MVHLITVAVISFVLLEYGVPSTLKQIGFGNEGIVRDSMAAKIQSAFKLQPKKGSWFSTLQSYGHKGLDWTTKGITIFMAVFVRLFYEQYQENKQKKLLNASGVSLSASPKKVHFLDDT